MKTLTSKLMERRALRSGGGLQPPPVVGFLVTRNSERVVSP